MSTYDSRPDTQKHIDRVSDLLDEVGWNLSVRSENHDRSKLEDPEKAGWDEATPKLANLTYGTEEYRANLREIRPIIEHHYAHNSHHPEYYENGVDGMSLLDVMEMLCDWKAASERGKGNDFMVGMIHNKERFNLSDQLYNILINTAKELGYDRKTRSE